MEAVLRVTDALKSFRVRRVLSSRKFEAELRCVCFVGGTAVRASPTPGILRCFKNISPRRYEPSYICKPQLA